MNKISEDMAVVDTISSDLVTLLVGSGEDVMVVEAGELPEGIREGDWMKILEDGEFEIMQWLTVDRRMTVRSKMDKLRRKA